MGGEVGITDEGDKFHEIQVLGGKFFTDCSLDKLTEAVNEETARRRGYERCFSCFN